MFCIKNHLKPYGRWQYTQENLMTENPNVMAHCDITKNSYDVIRISIITAMKGGHNSFKTCRETGETYG